MTKFKKHISFSNFWIKHEISLVIFALIANHLTDRENFLYNNSYHFPWHSFLTSILLGNIIMLIGYLNFKYYEKKYFHEKINNRTLLHFLFSTLGYITIAYLILYFSILGLMDGNYNVYGFLTGFFLTILVSSIAIAVLFGKNIYELHKMIAINGKLKVKQGGKITLVGYSEIAFIHSENKIVYVIKIDGTSIITDFTLNEVESTISELSFFRANRQIILHSRSIEEVQSIENGKLLISLKSFISDQKPFQINISRYKKQAFLDWFENKL